MQLHTDTCLSARVGVGWGWSRPAAHSAARLPRFSRRIGRGPRPSSTCLRAEQLTPTRPVACLPCLQHNNLALETSAPSAGSNKVECAVLYAAPSPAPILKQDHELPISKLHSCALRGPTSIAVLQVKPLAILELQFPRLRPPPLPLFLIISGGHVFAGTCRPVPSPSEAQEEAEERQACYCCPSCSRRPCQGRRWDLIRGLVCRPVSTLELW